MLRVVVCALMALSLCGPVLVGSATTEAEAQSHKTTKRVSKRGLRPQVLIFRGFADVFSTGLNDLGRELRESGVPAQVTGAGNASRYSAHVEKLYRADRRNRPIILIGHSIGADTALRTAIRLDKREIPVRLVVTLDPTIRGPLTNNVRRYLNYHTTNGDSFAALLRSPGYRGRLDNINIKERPEAELRRHGHFSMDNSAYLRGLVKHEVLRALR